MSHKRKNKSASECFTNVSGPVFHIIEDITQSDIAFVCAFTTNAFNRIFKTTRYLFQPDPREGGGILLKDFPCKVSPNSYKAIQFCETDDRCKIKWPLITNPDNVVDDWLSQQDEDESKNPILFLCKKPFMAEPSKERMLETELKAVNGASLWSMEELHIMCISLAKIGLIVQKNKYPKKKSLTTYGIYAPVKDNIADDDDLFIELPTGAAPKRNSK